MATTANNVIDRPAVPGVATIALEVLLAPGVACDRIARRRRSALAPLLLLIGGFALLWGYYYYHVDFPWLMERMIEGAASGSESGTRAGMRAGLASMTPGMMLAVTLVSGGMSILFIIAFRGLYLALAAKLFNSGAPSFFSWFSLSIWAALPTVLSILLSGIYVLSQDVTTMMPAHIAVASLNNLVLHLPDSSPWAAMSNSFDVLLLWSFVIMGIGFSRWTGASPAAGQLVAFTPFALLYGIWALVIIL